MFLLALDAIILIGPYSQARVVIAVGLSLLVVLLISLIWRRNTKLESLAREKASP